MSKLSRHLVRQNLLFSNDNLTMCFRKTAVNPAFKRKKESETEESSSNNKVLKTEDLKGKENDEQEKSTEASARKEPKKNEEKSKLEKEPKHKVEASNKEEEEEPMEVDSPVKSSKKKKKRVLDSDSEEETIEEKDNSVENKGNLPAKRKSSPVKDKKDDVVKKVAQGSPRSPKKNDTSQSSPKKDKNSSSPSKSEKRTMSNFFTPKSSKTKSQTENIEEKQKPEVKCEEPSKETEVKEETKEDNVKDTKPKNAFAGFFSPKPNQGGSKRNEGGSDYEKKVLSSSYHPVDDCFWSRGEAIPFLALAKTLESIEATSSRLKTIEVLSNYFRSVMVQTPADLQPSVYMTLNRLAPAWEGIELGIGESLLIKAIANSTGRSAAQIKADMGKLGDLGLVAEQSRGGQRTMFQPKQLTVQAVFEKLKDIAALTGHSSGTKKVEKIQALLVACRGSEARCE